MIEFFVANKEWLFSGLLTAVLVGIARWLWFSGGKGDIGSDIQLDEESSRPKEGDSVKSEDGSTNVIKDNIRDTTEEKWLVADRVFSVCEVVVGDYVEYNIDNNFGVRVEVKSIEKVTFEGIGVKEQKDAARLKVSSGASEFQGGNHTRHVGVDRFLVPAEEHNSFDRSVFSFYHKDSYTTHSCVSVGHINPHQEEVEVKAVLVRFRSIAKWA